MSEVTFSICIYIPEGVNLRESELERAFFADRDPVQTRSYPTDGDNPPQVEYYQRSRSNELCIFAEHSWGQYPGDEAVTVEFASHTDAIKGVVLVIQLAEKLGIMEFMWGRTGEKHLKYTRTTLLKDSDLFRS